MALVGLELIMQNRLVSSLWVSCFCSGVLGSQVCATTLNSKISFEKLTAFGQVGLTGLVISVYFSYQVLWERLETQEFSKNLQRDDRVAVMRCAQLTLP